VSSALTENGAPGRLIDLCDEGTTEGVGNHCPYAIDAARRSRLPTISTKAGDTDRRWATCTTARPGDASISRCRRS
jgi:hypothetical protein